MEISKELSNELSTFLSRYLAFYKDFLDIEQQKFESISHNDIEKLNALVTKEQAFMLQSRGMEVERDKILVKIGVADVALKEIIPSLHVDFISRVQTLYDELSDILLDLKDVNSRSNSLTELRLHRIDTEINRLEKRPETKKDYTNTAQVQNKSRSVISKKI